jgi:hypothetical protein
MTDEMFRRKIKRTYDKGEKEKDEERGGRIKSRRKGVKRRRKRIA